MHLTGWVLPHLKDGTVLAWLDPPSGSAYKRVLEFECKNNGTVDWAWKILDELASGACVSRARRPKTLRT